MQRGGGRETLVPAVQDWEPAQFGRGWRQAYGECEQVLAFRSFWLRH